jgi:nucleoid DNA-binding protein/cell division septation protein DedD
MQIAVGELIASLLYENDTVSIPGLGAFIKKKKAASLDQIQDKALPNASLIEFNSNLAMDDGLLIAHIKDRFHLSYMEAKRTVSEYVQQVNQALDRKEIILFPQVGRLYNDYEQKLQFIPDNTNFNLATFGLPAVEISPVKKTSSTPPAAVVQSAPSRFQWLLRNWPLLLILLILLGVLVAFMVYYPKYLQNQQGDPTADLPTNRLNVKPPVSDAPDTATTESPTVDTEEDYDDEPDQIVPETPLPNTKTCIIALGIFKEKSNVDQLAKKLINAGYEPYIEKLSSSTRVGVQFPYTEQQEINNTLNKIRSQFVKDAFILKK